MDKLVSSLSATVVGIAVTFIGLNNFTRSMTVPPGMDCGSLSSVLRQAPDGRTAGSATLIAMKGYSLTGEKMKEIQAVNACRRDHQFANGMKLDTMEKWQTVDNCPRGTAIRFNPGDIFVLP